MGIGDGRVCMVWFVFVLVLSFLSIYYVINYLELLWVMFWRVMFLMENCGYDIILVYSFDVRVGEMGVLKVGEVVLGD